MRSQKPSTATVILAGLLFLAWPVAGSAEDTKKPADDESVFPGMHTDLQLTGIGYGGPSGKAKFQEYRDLPQGGQADWIQLDYENEPKTYDLNLKVKKAGLEDMDLLFTGEDYGKWKFSFEFNRIPHRFQDDVGTIYGGIGSRELRISPAVQAAAQAAASDAAMVAVLRNALNNGFNVDEIGLERNQFKLSFELLQLDPFSMGIDLYHEERQGDRLSGEGFGLETAVGLATPIDYGTTDASIWAAYDKGCLHLKVFYGFDYFENRNGNLSFSNPFRAVDSTDTLENSADRASGAHIGRAALEPTNLEHRVGFESGIDAPAKTRITFGFTAAWREDDPGLLPYTTNTAIATGAVSEQTGVPVPFDAFNPANLPQRDFNGEVLTQRANFQVANRAIDHLEIRARYRFYNFDNESDQIRFPGEVLQDATWDNDPAANLLYSYWKHEAGIEFAYHLPHQTILTLGYKFVDTERKNREVDSMLDHTLLCAVDSKPVNWLDHRISYEHTWRRTDDYDFAASFPGNPFPPNLPFLRKYDESPYERDKVNAQFTFPTEKVTPFAGYTLTLTDYDASFGLKKETTQGVNAGVNADPWGWMHAAVVWNLRWFDSDQQSRTWMAFDSTTPPGPANGVGDPYFTDTGDFSFSNWEAQIAGRVTTIDPQLVFHLIPDKLDLENKYTYMHSAEGVSLENPVDPNVAPATAQQNTNNPNDERFFGMARSDNTTWNNLRVQFRWKVKKNLTVVFGYLYENYRNETCFLRGFEAIPLRQDGSFVGVLSLNRHTDNYESDAGFVTVVWNF